MSVVSLRRAGWRGKMTASLLVALISSLLIASSGKAATGDVVHMITGANPNGCGLNRGLAFDGTNLLVSCDSQNAVDIINPSTGALVATKPITGLQGTQASAWDATRNKLWVCSGHDEVYLVDMSSGVATLQFSVSPASECPDGLAYDGSDDTIWTSPDAQCFISHFTTAGVQIGSTVNICDPPTSISPGNSGIAVGGSQLYLGTNGGAQVYQVPKDFTSSTLFFDNPEERRVEDMECDNITFAAQGKQVMWIQDAFDRIMHAVEISAGACGFGGLPPAAPVAPAPAPVTAAPVQQTSSKPSAKASIRGPRKCVRSSARIRVRGRNISRVTYKLNGKRIKRAKGNKTSVKIKAKKLRRKKVNRVTARITFKSATAAKAQTKRFTLTRCARRAVKPKFTG